MHVVDEKYNIALGIPGPIEQLGIKSAIENYHYLNKYPDPRCMSFAYSVYLRGEWVGCLVFGRPQAGKLFKGPFTYGSIEDIEAGRAKYCRWEVLNLSRVWFSPSVQTGGSHCNADELPGFIDRKGQWRSTFASSVIRSAIDTIRLDYLLAYPPVFFRKWIIGAVLSYCDTRLHRGTIYRSSGFGLASCNRDKIETYTFEGVRPLNPSQEMAVRLAGKNHPRSIKKRNAASVSLPANFLFGGLT